MTLSSHPFISSLGISRMLQMYIVIIVSNGVLICLGDLNFHKKQYKTNNTFKYFIQPFQLLRFVVCLSSSACYPIVFYVSAVIFQLCCMTAFLPDSTLAVALFYTSSGSFFLLEPFLAHSAFSFNTQPHLHNIFHLS